jgi:hypothetical protein
MGDTETGDGAAAPLFRKVGVGVGSKPSGVNA